MDLRSHQRGQSVPESSAQNNNRHNLLSPEQLDLLARNIAHLPTFPVAARKLVRLAIDAKNVALASRPIALNRLAALVQNDPAMSAEIMRLVSRSSRQTVRKISDALPALGWESTRMALLTLAGRKDSTSPVRAGTLDRMAFWRHSLRVALAARELASRGRLDIDPDEAHLAGLLHDIGKLALYSCMPKSYLRAMESAGIFRGNTNEYERNLLGVDHSTFGRRVAEFWNMPPSIRQVIWLHHHPPETMPVASANGMLLGVVAMANAIAHYHDAPTAAAMTPGGITDVLAAKLHIERETVSQIAADLPRLVDSALQGLGWSSDADATFPPDLTAEALCELGEIAQDVAGRNRRLASAESALKHSGKFLQAAAVDAGVPEMLLHIARASRALETSHNSERPTIAYSIGQEADPHVTALRYDGAERMQWKSFGRAESFNPQRLPAALAPGYEILARLAQDPASLNDWIDPHAYVHDALLNHGRWIGGVLRPADNNPSDDTLVRETLVGVMSAWLAVVQIHSRTTATGDELAAALQSLARSQEELAENRTLAALIEMAAGAAHELNTPLTVISGRAQLMSKKTRNADRKTWQLISEQAKLISDTITDLMILACPPAAKPGRTNSAELLDEAQRAFFASGHPRAAETRVDVEPDSPASVAWADAAQIRDVLVELIANAANAAERRPQVRLAAQADPVQQTVLITVADAGPGMDAQTLRQAYTPLFSRQKAGRRRGMGLPRAHRFVEINGGRMWIESAPAHGTTVFIQLPAAPAWDAASGT